MWKKPSSRGSFLKQQTGTRGQNSRRFSSHWHAMGVFSSSLHELSWSEACGRSPHTTTAKAVFALKTFAKGWLGASARSMFQVRFVICSWTGSQAIAKMKKVSIWEPRNYISPLFADDVSLFASAVHDLHNTEYQNVLLHRSSVKFWSLPLTF